MDWQWLFFSFDGRINRAKWWLAALVFVVISIVIWFVVLPLLGISIWSMGASTGGTLASIVVTLILAYPVTAVMVKRLNDRDRPAWFAAIFWAPTVLSYIGQLTGLGYSMQMMAGEEVMMPTGIGWVINILMLGIVIWGLVELGCLRGTAGPNRHGPDPLQSGS
ncbi:MAG: DUF805 domain-containing protein [Propylenella sp.]